MKVKYFKTPVPHFIIEDVFDKNTAKNMFNEVIKNKKVFTNATVGENNIIRKDHRNNTVFYVDNLFMNRRNESEILKGINNLFSNDMILSYLSSSSSPLNDFTLTNLHRTQVSRYGDSNQKYDWHIDSLTSNPKERHLTFVYYFDKPITWKGGDLEITDSPIHEGKLLNKKSNIKRIKIKPNSLVIFGSNNAHRVTNTKSPKKFEDGRFSINCWVGFRNV